MFDRYVIGVDFGTDSVRAAIVKGADGSIMSSASMNYKRWQSGLYCESTKNQFRQHPLDYIEGLTSVIKSCLESVRQDISENIKGLSIATTGSTPVAVDKSGIPLALKDSFSDNPNAMFILWKDHTATKEAEEINDLVDSRGWEYLKYVGGAYSPEWYWAKLLHIIRTDARVREECYGWVEHSDWLPFLLTGGNSANEIKRNVCAAGHKGLWGSEFGGLPDLEFFKALDPLVIKYAQRFGNKTYTADQPAGTLSTEWSKRLGLPETVVVGVGAIDAHIGAVGSGIKPYTMTKVMGTSTCDMLVVPESKIGKTTIKGISGQVKGSIIPGLIGLEAGQSAFGDIYAWFRDLLLWPLNQIPNESISVSTREELGSEILEELSKRAVQIPLSEDCEFATDWFNGRRSPNVNASLKACIGGLTLGSNAPRIYKALVEATCLGARAIVECLERQGIVIKEVVAVGGIAQKSSYIMQILADVLNKPIIVPQSEQTVALGAAMLASVVSGIHPTLLKAIKKMSRHESKVYMSRTENLDYFNKMYELYRSLG